ncbi:MAG: hypothetical protein LC687_02175 [Actinobacteria bacterium]|nr:hypothetical protein [Actinomycetota bacterium]
MKAFETKAKEAKIVEFDLDGREMVFTTPKRAGLIASVVNNVGLDSRNLDTDSTRDLLNWLGEGLSEEDAEYILDRLKDPDDDFDLADINEIAKYLLSQGSNRPTRRRRG